jgi:hypothetical protein
MTDPTLDEMVNSMLNTYYKRIKGLREKEAENRKQNLAKVVNECLTEAGHKYFKEGDAIHHHVPKANKARVVKSPKKVKTFLGNKSVKYDTIW